MTPVDHETRPTRYLQRGEGRIAYDRAGTGPLVLLIPGMGELRSSYRFLVPRIVAAGYTAVSCDLRGHGDSDATFGSYGDVETAADITALLESLGEPAVVVGNSMAAGAAVLVAADRPELVRGLVLVGPFVRNPADQSAFARLAFRLLMARPWAASVWGRYLPTLYAGRKPADFADYRAAVAAALRRPGHAAAFSATTRTSHAAAAAALPRVTAPALIVMGALDPDFPEPAREAAWIATALGGESLLVPDTGHYPQAQDPERVGEALVRFLERTGDRA